jgi:hypothetical protein
MSNATHRLKDRKNVRQKRKTVVVIRRPLANGPQITGTGGETEELNGDMRRGSPGNGPVGLKA